MKNSKENIDVNMTAEEIIKYIKESDEMKKPPKKRLYYKTKIYIVLSLCFALFLLFTIFIWKPFEYKLVFEKSNYNIFGYNIKADKNKNVIIDGKTVYVGENIVDILPYKNYKDESKEYLVFLSEYGNIYSYNIHTQELYKYDGESIKVSKIESSNLDIYDVIEITTNKGEKYILGSNGFVKGSSAGLKSMDKAVYNKDDCTLVYLKENNLYICDYDKIKHFSMEEEQWATEAEEAKVFADKDGNAISYIDVICKEYGEYLYIYGITSDFKLTVYSLDISKNNCSNLLGKIELDIAGFNKELERFDYGYNSEYSVRVLAKDKTSAVEIILDRLMLGSISNDETLFTYSFNLKDGTVYDTLTYDETSVRYDKEFYTCYNNEKIECAFLESHGDICYTVFDLENGGITTKKKKLDENLSCEKIYEDSGKLYVYIKESIKNEYLVFENTIDIVYHNYILEDFVKD